jgi:RNase H-like domain found in reverse transcriptase/Reverse transcriptase (RNA-dependent DNA polymerase)/Integrase zinc binding domain/Chromo (CHRromatin Organisation MOdifier) domain
MNLDYAKYLRVPIQRLKEPRKLFNVDGTPNKSGELLYFTDLQTQTGTHRHTLRFFLSNLGENKVILGYPWFAAFQPRIDWRRGWIDHSQLPVILRTPDAARARFIPRQINKIRAARAETIYICRLVPEPTHTSQNPNIPNQYRLFSRVFSEEASHEFPPSRPWDHAIELKPGAPAALPGKLIPLSQAEQEELRKFVKEHMARGTIRPSKSPYKARFFYIKKKDGKLRPVQDYRPVNQWTIRNAYPLPLIPELIDRLTGCSLYTKFDIRWGYNNVRIKEGDEWKAAFITNEGLFEPTVMFFGLTNSPATFQTMMNSIFSEEIAEKWLTVYMDDMAIHTRCNPEETEEQHVQRHRNYVKRILAKLMEHNLFLKPEKCSFEQPSIEFLGVRVTQGQVQMDDTKVEKVRNWRRPTNVTEVRKFLGFTGYYRYFIKDYSKLARPLLQLTHLSTPWTWGETEEEAFETLRKAMTDKPVLRQPDFTKPFVLLTDASAYGVGAILSQEGGSNNLNTNKKPRLHPVAYYSATFTETERNYDIYERELLAIMKAITHWRPYLIWTKEPFTILTDHANLLHWKSPRKLNRRTARWHGELQDYNFKLQHVPGKLHTAADALSRPTGADEGKEDNQQMTMIPEAAFIRLMGPDSDGSIEHTITIVQNRNRSLMEEWTGIYPIERINNPGEPFWRDIKNRRLVIPPDQGLKRELMNIWHEGAINGHPGRDETIRRINKEYFWPGAKTWITDYIKGCATCQQNKNLTHRVKTPLFRIPSSINAKPFSHIAMDLITGLPESDGYDAILTIVDHGCSRAAIFLPCSTTITGAGIAQLYLEHLFRWFGIPQKIISDRDPRFTSHFARELTKGLGISQNLSTAFHPQTDGLSERTNQWVEQYLRLIAANQNEWSKWLPMATAVHNNSKNSTTGFAPSELLIGWEPPLATEQRPESKNQTAEEYLSNIRRNRLMAIHALNKIAQRTDTLPNRWTPGQLAWLEGKNLPLAHGTAKLAPRRHGPFRVTEIVSPVAVRLELPPQWKIHPVFHISLLTPYSETPSHGPNFTRPPPDLIDGEEEYEVEQIRSHRTWGRSKTLQYLIKWTGYPESDNTWENADQIHAPKLIKLYHETLPRPHIKAQRAHLGKDHLPTISPPKAFSRPHSSATILRESTAALVWPATHETHIRSACNPLIPALSLSHPRTRTTPTLLSATFTGNPSTLQTNTANSDNLPSAQHPLAPPSSTPCLPSDPTTHQTSRQTRHPFNSLLESTRPHPCPSHRGPYAPPSRPTSTLTTPCYERSPTVFSRPSPTARRAPVSPPSDMKTGFTTSSRRYYTTRRPSTTPPRGTSSITGRSPTSTSRLATGYTKRPSGYGSTTTAPCRATTRGRARINALSSSTSTPPLTSASTPLLNRFPRGSVTCLPARELTSRSSSRRWPTRMIGALPEKSPATAPSTTISRPWPSKSKNTSAIWTLHAHAWDHVSPDLCWPAPRKESQPWRTCRGRLEPYVRGGRRPPACPEASTSVLRR